MANSLTDICLDPQKVYMNYIRTQQKTKLQSWGEKNPETASAPYDYNYGVAISKDFESSHQYFELLLNSIKQNENHQYNENLVKLIEVVKNIQQNDVIVVKLNMLVTKRLHSQIEIMVEPDDDGFIARSIDFPIFGFGEDRFDAIDAFKHELESLYFDLTDDDDFSDEWQNLTKYLKEIVEP